MVDDLRQLGISVDEFPQQHVLEDSTSEVTPEIATLVNLWAGDDAAGERPTPCVFRAANRGIRRPRHPAGRGALLDRPQSGGVFLRGQTRRFELEGEWNLVGAPILQQISDLDGVSPGKLFFGSLPLVMDSAPDSPYAISPDLALRKLKWLELHPVIRNGQSGRCDFGLEVWRKTK